MMKSSKMISFTKKSCITVFIVSLLRGTEANVFPIGDDYFIALYLFIL